MSCKYSTTVTCLRTWQLMTLPRKHKESFRKLLGTNPCLERNLFVGIKCLLQAEPTLKMNDEVRELVRVDRGLTATMIAEELGVNRETVRLIQTEDLGMIKVCVKMIPRDLAEQQRTVRRDVSEFIGISWIWPIFTESSWFYQCWEWRSPNSPKPKKARNRSRKWNVCCILFFFFLMGLFKESRCLLDKQLINVTT